MLVLKRNFSILYFVLFIIFVKYKITIKFNFNYLYSRNYRVIEINASAARTGRHVLQLFAEATQSHHLSASRLGAVRSGGDVEDNDNSSNAAKKRAALNDDRAETIVILFEEIDVHCVEDRGLFAALVQLCSSTKRPIIMTCTGIYYFYYFSFFKKIKTKNMIFFFRNYTRDFRITISL